MHSGCTFLDIESPKGFLCEAMKDDVELKAESSTSGTRRRQCLKSE